MINHYKWERLYKKQSGRCFYCLQKFDTKRNSINALRKVTVDHIRPVCEMKGLSQLEKNANNTVLACQECNRRKANISAELFLEGYEALNIAPYDEPSFYIAVKTRNARRFYHYFLNW